MNNRKFQVGNTVTNGITEKTIIALHGNHYLTNCGRIDYVDEDKWELVK